MDPGLNLEFAREEALALPGALRAAREAGYRYVEAYVYTPVSVRVNSHVTVHTTSSYHHLEAGTADPRALCGCLRELGLALSALDAHTSLLLPAIGIPHLQRVIDLAADLACPLVMSDEGPVPADWIGLDQCFDLLCLSLNPVIRHAQHRGVRLALELHNLITARPDYLERMLARFGPDELGVNFDTGNSFLAGNDPVAYVRRVANRVVHVHVKDIPAAQLMERGKVTGTRVGVAVGEGIVDLGGVVTVLGHAGFDGVLSVECGTLKQAEASRPALEAMIAEARKHSRTNHSPEAHEP